MKVTKVLPIILTVILLTTALTSSKHKEQKPLSEYTNPKSPSYVPIPFPKNKKEIIADLKYYAVDLNDQEGTKYVSIDNQPPLTDKILREIFLPQSPYKIDSIWKVKNRTAHMPDNYTWLIIVTAKDGSVAMRISMAESGLVYGCSAFDQRYVESAAPKNKKRMLRYKKKVTRKTIENILSNCSKKEIQEKKIKSIERIAFPSGMGDDMSPLWEICTTDGTTYYYNQFRDIFYGVDQHIPWVKGKNGYRENKHAIAPHPNFLPDSIGDRLIILRVIPHNNQ